MRHSGKNSGRKLTLLSSQMQAKGRGGRSLEPASSIVLEEEAPPGAAAGCRQDQNRKKTGGLGWWMISIPISLSFHLIISCRCLPLGRANRKLGGKEIHVRQIRVQLPGA